ncbi:MAG: ABC transporter permease [Erysipelothrix sp.]|nr:ABC transporter permease [Erysipelothrix sp.]
MKELIRFSLARRYVNKTNKIVLVVLFVIFLVLGFIDPIVKFFNSEFDEPIKIRVDVLDNQLFIDNLIDEITVNQESMLSISEDENGFIVRSQQSLQDIEKAMIETVVQNYERDRMIKEIPESIVVFERMATIPISYEFDQADLHQKTDSLFFVITAIYFVMLGFAGMLASEVVAEKTSNILEIIGTSVSLKTHYYSKIVIGWLSVLVQFSVAAILLLVTLGIRNLYDQGKGLLKILHDINILIEPFDTFYDVISFVFANKGMLVDLSISLLFLFIGILFIQILLVLLTTKVSSIEEAGALQNPFYIFLLIIYYMAIMLNNPVSMSIGMGKWFSFVPLLSMLFMPARIMMVGPPVYEVLISLGISGLSLLILVKYGEGVYVRNILNFTKKIRISTV